MLGKISESQDCCSTQAISPTELIRNSSRQLREQAARLEKLADQFERMNWNQETTQAFFENIK